MQLSEVFNSVAPIAIVAGGAIVTAGLAWWKGPKQLKPKNEVAKVITARGFPNILKAQKIVAKNGAKFYLGWGASDESEVPLETFKVEISRKGKDEALTLDDKVKAEVAAEFYVRVDTSSDAAIIQAMESLGGKINQEKIREYCTPKFDAALRAAAAQMHIEQIQTEREKFRAAVKSALDSLKDDGLILVDVALRQLNQSPIGDFDANNFFDAQGMKKVTTIINDSKEVINKNNQETETRIAEKDKIETNLRLTVTREKTQAELEQQQEIERLKAEQARQVVEIQAEQKRQADLAKLAAEQEVAARQIKKDQEVGVAEAAKLAALEVAKKEGEQKTVAAEIAKTKAKELAEEDKRIALQKKAEEVAAAEKAANEARALAVAASQQVLAAEQIAVAERNKKIAVLTAEQKAEQEAASVRIASAAQVAVAENEAKAVRVKAEADASALQQKATAEAAAAKLRAEGAYAENYQPLKAAADGKLAEAAAEERLNEARNKLSPEARALILELERVKITPQALETMVAAIANIDSLNVTSISGAPGFGSGTSGEGGSGNSNVFDQFYDAARRNALTKPMVQRLIKDVGGDPKIADNMPDFGNPANDAAAVQPPAVQVVTQPDQAQPPARKAGAPKPAAG
jgi:uncharacterized membrane protein YqiK